MAFFITMSPFVIYASLLSLTSASISLFAGATVSLALVGYDLWRGRSVKLLAAGTVVTFSALGGYLLMIESEWSDFSVRLAINLCILAIVLVSIAIKLPFTIQYAREQVEPEVTREPGFLRVNYILTWAWVGAIVLMLIADILMLTIPSAPLWVGLGITFAVRNAAVYFTKWYPDHWVAKFEAKQAPRTDA
jgi:hypothetical protein